MGGERWQIDAVIEAPGQSMTTPPGTTTMLTSANLPELAAKGR